MRDTKREAEVLGLPFGHIADPIGAAVERCYALFDLARARGVERAMAREFARGVWSRGEDTREDGAVSPAAAGKMAKREVKFEWARTSGSMTFYDSSASDAQVGGRSRCGESTKRRSQKRNASPVARIERGSQYRIASP